LSIKHGLRIRRADLSDGHAMLQLERQSPSAAHWSPAQYEALFGDTHQLPEHFACVIEDDSGSDPENANPDEAAQSLLGFLVARRIETEWELENIVVASGIRRRGLGRRLLAEFVSYARTKGGACIFLEVRKSNHSARALYEKSDFLAAGFRKNYYTNPSEDAALYKLDIG
jgi:ribosomal-protein-alanine acetyltransferase